MPAPSRSRRSRWWARAPWPGSRWRTNRWRTPPSSRPSPAPADATPRRFRAYHPGRAHMERPGLMRILASNPDTIGDVVLRQPLYRALIDAGHELTLLIRPLLAPVLTAIVPGARVLVCEAGLYDPRLTSESPAL